MEEEEATSIFDMDNSKMAINEYTRRKKKPPKLKVKCRNNMKSLNSSTLQSNVSLNSTLLKATLRSNNRSLAKALESSRQELYVSQKQSLAMQEETQDMKLKLFHLDRIAGLKDENINKEVEQRILQRFGHVRMILKKVSSSLLSTVDLLQEAISGCSSGRGSSFGVTPIPFTDDTPVQPHRSVFYHGPAKEKELSAENVSEEKENFRNTEKPKNNDAGIHEPTVEKQTAGVAHLASSVVNGAADLSIIVEQSYIVENVPLPFTEEVKDHPKQELQARKSQMQSRQSQPAPQNSKSPDLAPNFKRRLTRTRSRSSKRLSSLASEDAKVSQENSEGSIGVEGADSEEPLQIPRSRSRSRQRSSNPNVSNNSSNTQNVDNNNDQAKNKSTPSLCKVDTKSKENISKQPLQLDSSDSKEEDTNTDEELHRVFKPRSEIPRSPVSASNSARNSTEEGVILNENNPEDDETTIKYNIPKWISLEADKKYKNKSPVNRGRTSEPKQPILEATKTSLGGINNEVGKKAKSKGDKNLQSQHPVVDTTKSETIGDKVSIGDANLSHKVSSVEQHASKENDKSKSKKRETFLVPDVPPMKKKLKQKRGTFVVKDNLPSTPEDTSEKHPKSKPGRRGTFVLPIKQSDENILDQSASILVDSEESQDEAEQDLCSQYKMAINLENNTNVSQDNETICEEEDMEFTEVISSQAMSEVFGRSQPQAGQISHPTPDHSEISASQDSMINEIIGKSLLSTEFSAPNVESDGKVPVPDFVKRAKSHEPDFLKNVDLSVESDLDCDKPTIPTIVINDSQVSSKKNSHAATVDEEKQQERELKKHRWNQKLVSDKKKQVDEKNNYGDEIEQSKGRSRSKRRAKEAVISYAEIDESVLDKSVSSTSTSHINVGKNTDDTEAKSHQNEGEVKNKFNAYLSKPGKITFKAGRKNVAEVMAGNKYSSHVTLPRIKDKPKSRSKQRGVPDFFKEPKSVKDQPGPKSVFDLSLNESVTVAPSQTTYADFRERQGTAQAIKPMQNRLNVITTQDVNASIVESPHGIMLVLGNGKRTKPRLKRDKSVHYSQKMTNVHLTTPQCESQQNQFPEDSLCSPSPQASDKFNRTKDAGNTPPRNSLEDHGDDTCESSSPEPNAKNDEAIVTDTPNISPRRESKMKPAITKTMKRPRPLEDSEVDSCSPQPKRSSPIKVPSQESETESDTQAASIKRKGVNRQSHAKSQNERKTKESHSKLAVLKRKTQSTIRQKSLENENSKLVSEEVNVDDDHIKFYKSVSPALSSKDNKRSQNMKQSLNKNVSKVSELPGGIVDGSHEDIQNLTKKKARPQKDKEKNDEDHNAIQRDDSDKNIPNVVDILHQEIDINTSIELQSSKESNEKLSNEKKIGKKTKAKPTGESKQIASRKRQTMANSKGKSGIKSKSQSNRISLLPENAIKVELVSDDEDRPFLENDEENKRKCVDKEPSRASEEEGGRRSRRAAASVSYKEPAMNKKLRRGDPCASSIYKGSDAPQPKAGKKGKRRSVTNRHALQTISNVV